MSQTGSQRLEQLQHLNSQGEWVNRDLYRLMYREDLYIMAYERIKSKPGNMTPGTDGETLDGFSMDVIRGIIEEMRTEAFQFKPVRTVYIPKASGKLRKLGIPSAKDKVVQEVMRMMLEAIYDCPQRPFFSDASHGFRPGRSCHTALLEYRKKWSAINWIIEGDIHACFEEIDHGTLEQILRKKIADERFIALIRKLLKAGYIDLNEGRKDSLAGTPQGGIVSPILANIYLNELDIKVEEIRQRLGTEHDKRMNPVYRKLARSKHRLAKTGMQGSPEWTQIIREMRRTPSLDPKDPNFIRIKYLRYADDWIIGVQGPLALAEQIREEIRAFLAQNLALTLSEEKTQITNAHSESALFLGTELRVGGEGEAKIVTSTNGSRVQFKRRATGWQTVMEAPMDRILRKLSDRGLCTKEGEPIAKSGWIFLDEEQIVSLYASINRGIQNYYRFTDNFARLTRIQYILMFSCAKTLSAKLRLTMPKVFRKYGKSLTIKVRTPTGEHQVQFYVNHNWTRDRLAFQTNDQKVDIVRMAIKMRTRSKLGLPCCICGSPDKVAMHHLRHIRKADRKPMTGFAAIMRALNRKQIPVCAECHSKIHRGVYDGLRVADLAYDPR